VRVGLMQIKALQEDLASRIITERQTNGPYRSLHDVLNRVKPEMGWLLRFHCWRAHTTGAAMETVRITRGEAPVLRTNSA
jgi:hypothetical protein